MRTLHESRGHSSKNVPAKFKSLPKARDGADFRPRRCTDACIEASDDVPGPIAGLCHLRPERQPNLLGIFAAVLRQQLCHKFFCFQGLRLEPQGLVGLPEGIGDLSYFSE